MASGNSTNSSSLTIQITNQQRVPKTRSVSEKLDVKLKPQITSSVSIECCRKSPRIASADRKKKVASIDIHGHSSAAEKKSASHMSRRKSHRNQDASDTEKSTDSEASYTQTDINYSDMTKEQQRSKRMSKGKACMCFGSEEDCELDVNHKTVEKSSRQSLSEEKTSVKKTGQFQMCLLF